MATETTDPAPEAKTAVIYLRVSTREQATRDGQAEGFSIPAQRDALHRKAESMGIEIVAEFTDAGESAKSADRPHLQRMLQYLKLFPVSYVLVHKVDRLARNRRDDMEITLAIRTAGAQLISATENIDETPSGMLMHGVMSSIAEFYSNNLANEVHKGMSQKVKAGGTTNRAPLGYRNIGRLNSEGREERTVDIDPDRAELVTWAFKEFATGKWTLQSLTKELALRGLVTRRTPKQASTAHHGKRMLKMLSSAAITPPKRSAIGGIRRRNLIVLIISKASVAVFLFKYRSLVEGRLLRRQLARFAVQELLRPRLS